MKVNYSLNIHDLLALKSYIIGVVVVCPMGCRLDTCQVSGTRGLPVEARIEWVKGLGHRELVQLYLGHRECLHKRAG